MQTSGTQKKTKRQVRVVLLVLLWVWAILVFVIIDLFWNVEEFDGVRARSKVYAGMRRAAHKMVGEPILEDDVLAEEPALLAARRARERAGAGQAPEPSRRTVRVSLRPGVGVYRGHGTWTQWNDPGNKVGEGEYVDGQRHGTWLWRWPDGKRREARAYEKGRLNGMVESWYEDGTKQTEEHYVAGKPHGEWRSWHPDGERASVGFYQNGVPNGVFTAWHGDGQKAAEGEYHLGKRIGTWVFRDEKGRAAEERYEDGKKVR